MDGHRLCVPCPEWGFIGECLTEHDKISYKYYETESLEYKLLTLLTYHYDESYGHEASIVQRKLLSVVLLFEDARERFLFEKYVLQNTELYENLFSNDCYPEIVSENERERKVITDAIKRSRTLKEMQLIEKESTNKGVN